MDVRGTLTDHKGEYLYYRTDHHWTSLGAYYAYQQLCTAPVSYTHLEPQEFDCIYTGDLGQVGSSLLRELLAAEGLLVKSHVDCGCILFDAAEQQVKSGGSGPVSYTHLCASSKECVIP